MLQGAQAVLGGRLAAGVVTAEGPVRTVPQRIEFIASSHPLPDGSSVRAGLRALRLATQSRRSDESLVVLLSGGASAMLAVPAPGLSIDDKRLTIDALLRAGADIAQVNCVRKHISAIKGGRLAVVAGEMITFAISDVHTPQDDPATIGSGPTVADPSSYADALAVLTSLDPDVPRAVRAHLERGAAGSIDETPKPGDPRLQRCTFAVIANRRTAMQGAAREARRRGYIVRVLDVPTRGAAHEAGRIFAETALATPPLAGALCLIASGEPTVRVTGSGRGGRNQEFALGAARALAQSAGPTAVASAGTDGVDGPTDAAGAIVASTTLARLELCGIDLDGVLARNDAYAALDRLGDLITWGPTGTNAGDVHVALTMAP